MKTNDITLIRRKSRFVRLRIVFFGILFSTAITLFLGTISENSFGLWHLVYVCVVGAIGMELLRCVLEGLWPDKVCLQISPDGLLLTQPSKRSLAWSEIDDIASLDRSGKRIVKVSAVTKAVHPADGAGQAAIARPNEFLVDASRLDITREELLETLNAYMEAYNCQDSDMGTAS
ncbi:hypothetical protein [Roseibium sp.]|uniref:hypothetical protein n=1 Tax=Roseibium sp. TaxID=1936156 RepID=UPI003B50A5DA